MRFFNGPLHVPGEDMLQSSAGDFGKVADDGRWSGLGVGHPETREEPRDM
jgi:hypothetical protein